MCQLDFSNDVCDERYVLLLLPLLINSVTVNYMVTHDAYDIVKSYVNALLIARLNLMFIILLNLLLIYCELHSYI